MDREGHPFKYARQRVKREGECFGTDVWVISEDAAAPSAEHQSLVAMVGCNLEHPQGARTQHGPDCRSRLRVAAQDFARVRGG